MRTKHLMQWRKRMIASLLILLAFRFTAYSADTNSTGNSSLALASVAAAKPAVVSVPGGLQPRTKSAPARQVKPQNAPKGTTTVSASGNVAGKNATSMWVPKKSAAPVAASKSVMVESNGKNYSLSPSAVKRFDANKNGVLDPQELQKCRDDIEKLQAEGIKLRSPGVPPAAAAPRGP